MTTEIKIVVTAQRKPQSNKRRMRRIRPLVRK